MKVVVIGNGENVLRHNHGKFIDSCDRVIRINQFVVDGYEKHVGSKLDIYCAKWHKIVHRDREFLHKHNAFWFPYPKPPTTWGALGGTYPITSEAHQFNVNKFQLDSKEIQFLDDSAKVTLEKAFNNNVPSVGAVAVTMSQYIFPEAELYITGFDCMQSGWYWDPSHKCLEKCRNSIIHERLFFNKYEKNKLEG